MFDLVLRSQNYLFVSLTRENIDPTAVLTRSGWFNVLVSMLAVAPLTSIHIMKNFEYRPFINQSLYIHDTYI